MKQPQRAPCGHCSVGPATMPQPDESSRGPLRARLVAIVRECIDLFLFEEAAFAADRLRDVSGLDDDEALYLFALSRYHTGQPLEVLAVLRDRVLGAPLGALPAPHPMRLLYARVCLDSQTDLDTAERGVLGWTPLDTWGHPVVGSFGALAAVQAARDAKDDPGGAASYLAGLVCKRLGNLQRSETHFRNALKANDSLWGPFEALCRMGCAPDAEAIFGDTGAVPHAADARGNDESFDQSFTLHRRASTGIGVASILATPGAQTPRTPFVVHGVATSPRAPPARGLTPSPAAAAHSTPASVAPPPTRKGLSRLFAASEPADTTPGAAAAPVAAPKKRAKVAATSTPDTVAPASATARAPHTQEPLPLVGVRTRARSAMLATEDSAPPSRPTSAARGKGKRTTRAKDDGAAQPPAPSVTFALDGSDTERGAPPSEASAGEGTAQSQETEGQKALRAVYRALGTAFAALARFDCRAALALFADLPAPFAESTYAMCQVARAHLELGQYQESARVFEAVRAADPFCLENMELYSTALWHLRDEAGLSALASALLSVDRTGAQGWCAAGNCFSAQKEHASAIRLFERAVQVDSHFAYGYTLLGHEFVANEDFERAVGHFQTAIRVDPRHYNAWYGLGMILFRQEKYEAAQYHFERALSINPQSAVLHCYLGLTLNARGESASALEVLNKAAEIDGTLPLVQYNRAVVLCALDRHEEAIEILTRLRDAAPREASVYRLLSHAHRRLGHVADAQLCKAWATELDPRGLSENARDDIDGTPNDGEDDGEPPEGEGPVT